MKSIKKMSEEKPPRRILYVIYTNPAAYPPLEHSSRIFASAGWQVLFLGIGALGTADKLSFPIHENIVVRQLRFRNRGWRQKLHFFLFGVWTLFWTLRWRPKWIYASDMFSCPVALALSYLPGLHVIYHEHDYPAQLDRSSPVSRFVRLVLWCRRSLAKRATFCILPNLKRIAHFKVETGTSRPVICTWNCPSKEEVRLSKEILSTGAKLRLTFHGSINKDRLPLAILEAMSRLENKVQLTIVGYETVDSSNYVADFLKQAKRLGLSEAVEFIGALPTRGDLYEQAASCDIGLAFMPLQGLGVNHGNMTGASNKPFDYLACGLALLVSDLPEWLDMYVIPGYGLACDPCDPASIAQALLWFIDHPEETRKMASSGRERILQEWNYEMQFTPVLAEMERQALSEDSLNL